jgi:hypothetical protein
VAAWLCGSGSGSVAVAVDVTGSGWQWMGGSGSVWHAKQASNGVIWISIGRVIAFSLSNRQYVAVAVWQWLCGSGSVAVHVAVAGWQ